ncbi:MAG: hypothetical protein IH793_02500, partial [Acidobacteria bacterium]|nr:hypothetical protein [Acidobacteriota bacterium]
MKIALGVSGCIAAYKAAELVRLLQQEGLSVQVVMTKSAQEFVRPLTFAALTGQKVITGMFGGGAEPANVENAVEHIGVADSIDALVVAPATANLLGKLAQGIADDFLTTLYLATKAPVLVAPAMNVNMWQHPAVQANLAQLRERGVAVVEPDQGYLACGWTGPGRLATLEEFITPLRKISVVITKREGQRVAMALDGNPAALNNLTKKERKVFDISKRLLEKIADLDGLPKNFRLSEYFPHMMRDEAALARFRKNGEILTPDGDFIKPTGNPFHKERLGMEGYSYDLVDVLDTANLGGQLNVTLIEGFEPLLGDTFDVLVAGLAVSGTFESENFPDFNGLTFHTLYFSNVVQLEVIV